MYIVLVTAKALSERVPYKNILPLGGVPLAMRSVFHGLKAGLPVVVATDIPDLKVLAEQAGAIVVDHLPYSKESPSHQEVIEAALKDSGNEDKNCVLLQPTSPFRDDYIIQDCINKHKEVGGTVVTSDRKGELNGCVFVFSGGKICDYENTTYVRASYQNCIEIDTPEDYIDACQMDAFTTQMPIVDEESMLKIGELLNFDEINIVARSEKPIPQDKPVCYVNHCRGYDGGRADVLFLVSNNNLHKEGINKELREVAAKAEVVIIRNHDNALEKTLQELDFKVEPIVIKMPFKFVEGITTGTMAKWTFQTLGLLVGLIGFTPPNKRFINIKRHYSGMSDDIAYLTV